MEYSQRTVGTNQKRDVNEGVPASANSGTSWWWTTLARRTTQDSQLRRHQRGQKSCLCVYIPSADKVDDTDTTQERERDKRQRRKESSERRFYQDGAQSGLLALFALAYSVVISDVIIRETPVALTRFGHICGTSLCRLQRERAASRRRWRENAILLLAVANCK